MDTNRKMAGGKKPNTFSKSSRDLESMMSDIQLGSIDDSKPTHSWKRSSSLKSTTSEPDNGRSTPRGTSPSGPKKDSAKKPIKKRRKSFSLGMSSY